MAVVARKLSSMQVTLSDGAEKLRTKVQRLPARLDCFLVMNNYKRGVVADYFIND